MRTFIISLFTFLLTASLPAQVVTYFPQLDDFEQEITLVFNLNLSKNGKTSELLGKTDGLYLWAGAGTTDNTFQFTPEGQTNFNAAYEPGKLTAMGNNRWKITITPRTYFRVPAGKKIELLGLLVKNANGSAQTEDLQLSPVVENTLNEVVIKTKRPYISQLSDRTVLTPDADPTAAGSTVFEVLQKAPGLSSNGDDALQMNGKSGLAIYLNGKPTNMTGRDLTAFLQSLPAGSVDKIEIFANPPARFDAQGNAGIINIKMKKGQGDGFNGAANLAYTQQIHYRSQGGLNFNARKGSLNLFGQWSGQQNFQHTNGSLDRTVGDRTFKNTTIDQDKTPLSQYGRLGLDWMVSKRSTFGILFGGNDVRNTMNTPGVTRVFDALGQQESAIITQNDLKNNNRYTAANINYRYENADQLTITTDLDWTRFKGDNENNIQNRVEGIGFQEVPLQNRLNLYNDIDIYSAKIDAQKSLTAIKGNLEMGVKTSFSKTMNDFSASNFKSDVWVLDTTRTNLFDYQEDVHAGYMNFSQKRNDKWDWQAGLRGEFTKAKGINTDLRNNKISKPDTSYFSLFPSAFVQYVPNEKNGFKLAYTRRINRPAYQDLNPFERSLDAFTSERGNPYLRPAFSNNLELQWTYRQAASVTLGVNRTVDPLQSATILDGNKGYSTTLNLGRQDNAYLNLNVPAPIKSWWFAYLSFSMYYNYYEANLPAGYFAGGRMGANGYMSHSFTLPKSWKLNIDGWWNAPTRELIYKNRGLGSITIGVQKTFLDGKATAKLAVYDVLNTQRWRQSADFGNQQFSIYRKWESQGVRLAISYKFGNQKIKGARERSTEAEGNKGRIKSKG
jgi:iron complex outermembrane recepter protein